MTVRRGLAVVVLLPLALAGCSSGNDSGTLSTTSASSAAAKTAYELCDTPGDLDTNAFLAAKTNQDQTTAHIEGTIEIGALSGSSVEPRATTGSPSASASPTTSATGTGVPITGDVDGRDAANPKVRLTMGGAGAGGQLDLIMVDKVMYMNMGTITGNKFVRMTMEELAKQSGMDVSELTDPNAQLAKAKEALVRVSCVGREDVAGGQAAHLRMTLDTAKVTAAATGTATSTTSGGTRSSASSSAGSGTASSSSGTSPATGGSPSLPKAIDMDFWVDSNNRPVKFTSGTDQAAMTITYSKWGEPVTIQAPPTASVTQMPGLGGSGASGPATSPGPAASTS